MRAKDKEQGLVHAELLRRFSYDPATGVFRYRVAISNRLCSKIGQPAGCVRNKQYVVIIIDGYSYYAHRLAWYYTHGKWPRGAIDHINGVRTDNRLCNLRTATIAENNRNIQARRNNKIGLKGVSKYGHRYRAGITVDYKHIYLGVFETTEEAHAAYCKAAKELHGKYNPESMKEAAAAERRTRANRDLPAEKVRSDNSTGYRGVAPCNGRYRAQIYVNKKAVHLGMYDTAEEAHAAYCQALRDNHGSVMRQ